MMQTVQAGSNSIRSGISRRLRRGAALVALTGLLGAAAGPALATCLSPQERDALELRALQSRLMVSALACNARQGYNDFVVKYRAPLVENGRIMIGYFNRAYGRRSQREIDRFVTALANEASQTSNVDRARFCDESKAVLQALSGPAGQPLDVAPFRHLIDLPANHKVVMCTADGRTN